MKALTDSLRTRRVRRMNWSLSCLRRLLGMFSRGITKRSRSGTRSPISCTSPSTAHHSDRSSALFSATGGDFGRVRAHRSCPRRNGVVRGWTWSRFTRKSIKKKKRSKCVSVDFLLQVLLHSGSGSVPCRSMQLDSAACLLFLIFDLIPNLMS